MKQRNDDRIEKTIYIYIRQSKKKKATVLLL